jgi:hypothetical protein
VIGDFNPLDFDVSPSPPIQSKPETMLDDLPRSALRRLRRARGAEIPALTRGNRSGVAAKFAPSAGYHQGITSGVHGPVRPGPNVLVAPKLKHLDRIRPDCTDTLHVRFPLALPSKTYTV